MSDPNNDQIISGITSAWTGHKTFAEWLVKTIKPQIVVELGVDYGYSTFCFANQLQKVGSGKIYGIDWFQGDTHAGLRNTYDYVLEMISTMKLQDQIKIVKSSFDDALSAWAEPIDILHIDGLHTYEAAKNDFNSWSTMVKDEGIIIMHDVNIFYGSFRVYQVFNEIEGYYKGYFTHSAGLGVVTKNKELFGKIIHTFPNFVHSGVITKN